jgi:hypothetical protein
MIIDTGTGKTGKLFVLSAQFVEELTHLNLAHLLGQLVFAMEANLLGDLGIEVIKTLDAHLLEHRLKVGISMRKILIIH